MANSDEFVSYACELLLSAGRISTRRMFGGHGVYIDGLFAAIIDNDELYLKTDATTRPAFEREGCTPFVYGRKGEMMTLAFYHAPGEAMDAPHLMRPWARLALEAAVRARAAKKPSLKKKASKKTAARKTSRPSKSPRRVGKA